MHDHGVIDDFEVDSAVIGSEAVEGFSIAADLAKSVTIEMGQVGLGHLEGIKEFELLERIHP